MAVIVSALLEDAVAVARKRQELAHVFRLISRYVTEVMTICGHYLDGIGVVRVGRFRHQATVKLSDILREATSEAGARDVKRKKVVALCHLNTHIAPLVVLCYSAGRLSVGIDKPCQPHRAN